MSDPIAWRELLSLPRAAVPLTLFRSSRSGLNVLFANVPGPMINCFTTIRTETSDHRGLPHALEHLVFLGSETLPHKVEFETKCGDFFFFISFPYRAFWTKSLKCAFLTEPMRGRRRIIRRTPFHAAR